MREKEIKLGEYYQWTDVDGAKYLIFVIGREPFTGKLVAACDAWYLKVDILTKDDMESMEPLK